MKIKFSRVIFALIFVVALLTAIGFSPKEKPITFASEADFSIPALSNQSKSYESNIPSIWYDENKLFGINASNNFAPAIFYMDYISTDGTKNYANDEILTLTLGTPLEFYLEVGANNYKQSTASNGFNYDIFNYSSVFSLEVSVNYKNANYTVYNDSVNNLDFSGELEGANKPLNLEYNEQISSYDFQTLSVNSDYRLLKFTVTPLKVGADVLSIGVNDSTTYYTHETVINVVDDKGDGEILLTNAEIYSSITANTEYVSNFYNFTYFSGDLKNASIALPIGLEYEIPNNNLTVVDKNENDYLSDFANVNYELSLSCLASSFQPVFESSFNSYYFLILETGSYEISATSKISIEYLTDSAGSTKTYTLAKDFVFEVIVYGENSLTPSNSVKYDQATDSFVYPTNHALDFTIKLAKNSDYFTSSYTVDGGEYNGSKTYENEQSSLVSAHVINPMLKGFIDEFIQQIIEKDIENYVYSESPSDDQILQRREELYDSLTASLYAKYSADVTVSYTIRTENEETLLPKTELSYGSETLSNKITIDLQNPDGIVSLSTFSVPSIKIGNYEDIKDKARISLASSKKGVTLDNGVITFNNVEGISSYDLTLTADYGVYGTKSSEFTVDFTDSNLSVHLSERTVTMTLGEPSSVFLVVQGGENTLSIDKLDYEFISKKGIVKAKKNNLSPLTIDLTATDEGVDALTVIVRHDGLSISVLNLNVTILSSIPKNDQTLNFMQGNDVKIYLSNLSNVIDLNVDVSSIADKDYYFTWICLNNSVLEIEETSTSSARVTALRQGTTTVIAFCQFEDGSSVNAIASVSVLTDEPTVNLTFSKSDSTSFTIYDNILFGVNSHGFSFSNDISASWYIDGEKLTSAFDQAGNVISLSSDSLSFYNKLSAGLHTVKVEIIDNTYDLTLSSEREISITTITDKKRTLSFEDETINLVYTSSKNDIYTTQVLLDGVINNDYEYKWISGDADIIRIMSNDGAVSIEPLKSGETTLTVFCNVGVYEENYVRAELKVCVYEIETIAFIPVNQFPKPGEDIVIDVSINDKVGFKNLALPITVTNVGTPVEYSLVNGQIIIKSADSGKYEISTSFGDNQSVLSLTVTNFNMKEVITVALPYLVIVAIIAGILLVVLKTRNNPYKSIQNGINKLIEKFDIAISATKNASKEVVVKEYNSIISTLNRLIAKFNYYYDEGRDECKSPLQHALSIKKILLALISTSDKNFEKASTVLTTVKEKQLIELEQMVEEILLTLKVYDEKIAELNRQDKEEAKQNKKTKKSKLEKEEEQLKLLKNQGLIDDDE